MAKAPRILGTRVALAAGTAILAVAATAAPASAAALPDRYQGTFDTVSAVGCTGGDPAEGQVSGTWSITGHDTTFASFKVAIYLDGVLHVRFPAKLDLAQPTGNEVLSGSVPGGTLAGPLTLTVYKNGRFTYEIAPYTSPWDPGLTCRSVTYSGEVSSGL